MPTSFLCLLAQRTVSLLFLFLYLNQSVSGVLINEVSLFNDGTITDEDGHAPSWIELHNPGDAAVSLHNWAFSLSPGVQSWIFPDVSLPGRGYLVVFASGKNRRVVGQNLHTSFELPARLPYFKLLDPSGAPVSDLSLPYASLSADSSFGLEVSTNASSLVRAKSQGKVFVPSNDVLESNWVLPGFDDSSWIVVTNAIGYEMDPQAGSFELLTDSAADFAGTQGHKGWFYGYYFKTADMDRIYQTSNFTLFPNDGGAFGPNNYWTGAYWDWWPADPPWTTIRTTAVHPNGPNSGPEHWAIRRYKCENTGSIFVELGVRKTGPGGDGTTTMIFHNGQPVFRRSLYGGDMVGSDHTLELKVNTGDFMDFAIAPDGIAASAVPEVTSDTSDGTEWQIKIYGPAHLKSEYLTDVRSLMHSKNASIYYRIPFVVPSSIAPEILDLKVRYDAGFIAYLNGMEVVRKNAPIASASQGVVANSFADFSGVQGQKNWFYGYYHKDGDGDAIYSAADFVPFPANCFNGSAWHLSATKPPWTYIGPEEAHPNGINGAGGPSHWAIRRWESSVSGKVSVKWTAKRNNTGGNGNTTSLYLNGELLDFIVLPGANPVAVTRTTIIPSVQAGDFIDLALSSVGADGVDQDGSDGTVISMEISVVHSEATTWNTPALLERSDRAASQPETFDLKDFAHLLVPGHNMVALHGLNSSASDEDFLLEAELVYSARQILLHPARFFSVSTPLSENQFSDADLKMFRILNIDRLGNSSRVTWDSRAGQRFQVVYKDTLREDQWQMLREVVAEGPISEFLEDGSVPFRFYKIYLPE